LSFEEGENDVDGGNDEVDGSILGNGWEAGSVTTIDDDTSTNERSIPSTTAADDTSPNEISLSKIDRSQRNKMLKVTIKRM
jgi:hypothetical protein